VREPLGSGDSLDPLGRQLVPSVMAGKADALAEPLDQHSPFPSASTIGSTLTKPDSDLRRRRRDGEG